MKIFMSALLGAMILSSSVFAAEPELPVKKSEWSWITTCSTIGENPIEIINQKSLQHGATLNGFDQHLLFLDPATNAYIYKYLLSNEILCTTMHRSVYESRR